MLQITFVNDGTGDLIEGNYDVVVSVNGEAIYKCRVENHNRLSGWPGLVSCLAKQVFQED